MKNIYNPILAIFLIYSCCACTSTSSILKTKAWEADNQRYKKEQIVRPQILDKSVVLYFDSDSLKQLPKEVFSNPEKKYVAGGFKIKYQGKTVIVYVPEDEIIFTLIKSEKNNSYITMKMASKNGKKIIGGGELLYLRIHE